MGTKKLRRKKSKFKNESPYLENISSRKRSIIKQKTMHRKNSTNLGSFNNFDSLIRPISEEESKTNSSKKSSKNNNYNLFEKIYAEQNLNTR